MLILVGSLPIWLFTSKILLSLKKSNWLFKDSSMLFPKMLDWTIFNKALLIVSLGIRCFISVIASAKVFPKLISCKDFWNSSDNSDWMFLDVICKERVKFLPLSNVKERTSKKKIMVLYT